MRQIRVGESDEVGAHDETCVSRRKIVELRILENERPYEGKIDIRSSQLSGSCGHFN